MPIKVKDGTVGITNPVSKPGTVDNADINPINPRPGKFTNMNADYAVVVTEVVTTQTVTTQTVSTANIATGNITTANVTNATITGEDKVSGNLTMDKFYWCEDFIDEVADVQFESGLQADFWTTAGTNYAAGNVIYKGGTGGTLEAKCAAADNDSVTIIGNPICNTGSNPIIEFRVKIDDKATAAFLVGLAGAASAAIDTYPDNCFLVGINSDNAHTFGATKIVAFSNDDAVGVQYGNCGAAIVNDTFVIIRIDLTDTEQPRVLINGTEVAAASITGTVKAATALSPYMAVQNLAGGAIQRVMTIDYMKIWQDRG